jgi:hypothetical protein
MRTLLEFGFTGLVFGGSIGAAVGAFFGATR